MFSCLYLLVRAIVKIKDEVKQKMSLSYYYYGRLILSTDFRPDFIKEITETFSIINRTSYKREIGQEMVIWK